MSSLRRCAFETHLVLRSGMEKKPSLFSCGRTFELIWACLKPISRMLTVKLTLIPVIINSWSGLLFWWHSGLWWIFRVRCKVVRMVVRIRAMNVRVGWRLPVGPLIQWVGFRFRIRLCHTKIRTVVRVATVKISGSVCTPTKCSYSPPLASAPPIFSFIPHQAKGLSFTN